MYLSELHEYLEFNKKSFVESVLNGNYEFGIAEKRELLNKNGKKRDIIILNSIDRLLMRMVYQVLYKFTADCYSENSYAYQEGKGIVDAVEKSKSYILTGLNYVAELDIHKYFDNIEHKLLCKKLRYFKIDDDVLKLIEKYLKMRIKSGECINSNSKGVIQGSSLGPLLSNLFLDELDKRMEKENIAYIRFSDDIKIFADTYEKAMKQFHRVSAFLKDNRNLSLSEKKCGVYPALKRTDVCNFGI